MLLHTLCKLDGYTRKLAKQSICIDTNMCKIPFDLVFAQNKAKTKMKNSTFIFVLMLAELWVFFFMSIDCARTFCAAQRVVSACNMSIPILFSSFQFFQPARSIGKQQTATTKSKWEIMSVRTYKIKFAMDVKTRETMNKKWVCNHATMWCSRHIVIVTHSELICSVRTAPRARATAQCNT